MRAFEQHTWGVTYFIGYSIWINFNSVGVKHCLITLSYTPLSCAQRRMKAFLLPAPWLMLLLEKRARQLTR